jgi:hypothetical protein
MLGQSLNPQSTPRGKVTVLVERPLSDDEETRLRDQLVQLTDNPERAEITSTKSGGRTRFILDNVSSPAKFAEKITFAESKSLDEGTRTITIELKPE